MRIVCLTSNGYINCIEPFAYYWNKFDPDRHPVTVAHYDVAPTNLPDNFDLIEIGRQADYAWSGGLLKLLDMIDDPLIMLLLEDYFLIEPVKWRVVNSLISLMTHDTDVMKCDLTDDRLIWNYKESGYFHAAAMVTSVPTEPFQASLQAALWQKDTLKQFLDPNEDAWQFEKNGTKRIIAAREALSDSRFKFSQHLHVMGTRDHPVRYANAVGGAGNKPGVIEAKHMPAWMFEECVAKGWAHG